MKITFKEQAEKFLQDGATRKRKPFRPATVKSYRSDIETHLVPLIGKTPLQSVANSTVKDVVAKLIEKKLSANTIARNVFLIKSIRKSAVNQEGEQLCPPIVWNSQFIDAPVVENLKQPTVDATVIQDAITKALAGKRANCAGLYAVLAGTGLRIAEALAIRFIADDNISTVWVPGESKIIVRQQRDRAGKFGPTKTKAGVREVDLHPDLNKLVNVAYTDLVFPGHASYYRDWLVKDGITGGFHAFRRFRTTHLRMNNVPQALVDFWDGHAAGNMAERYTKVAGEIESRKQHAERAGLGFSLVTA